MSNFEFIYCLFICLIYFHFISFSIDYKDTFDLYSSINPKKITVEWCSAKCTTMNIIIINCCHWSAEFHSIHFNFIRINDEFFSFSCYKIELISLVIEAWIKLMRNSNHKCNRYGKFQQWFSFRMKNIKKCSSSACFTSLY